MGSEMCIRDRLDDVELMFPAEVVVGPRPASANPDQGAAKGFAGWHVTGASEDMGLDDGDGGEGRRRCLQESPPRRLGACSAHLLFPQEGKR